MKYLLSLLALCTTSIYVSAQSVQDSFLVKPYLQFATQNSMHILWETTAPASTIVEYGEALQKANEPNLPKIEIIKGTRNLHEVKLDNLKTSTKYLYKVKSITEEGQIIESPVYTFKTAVKDDEATFFAFIGDTQFNSRTPWAWGKIANRVWSDRPHFIIHAGDLVDTGTRKTDWTQHFFPNGHVAMSRFPMYTVLGNHEQDAQYYYDYMVNPAPEYYYTFHYGNIQFFMIDTNRDIHEGSEQYDWLEWELAKSDADWKIVVHHHPPFSSEENDHGDTYIGASTYGTHARNLVPLYEAYGIDFCLFGHTHLYERTWPLFEDAVNLKNGVVYINSGGAGGGLEDFDPSRSWFTQELQTGHHYCTFAIYDKTLQFKAIDHEGSLFDTFQLTKESNNSSGNSMIQPPAPHFKTGPTIFQESSSLSMEPLESTHKIYYTIDGTEPNMQSTPYEGPISITETLTFKARVYTTDGKASRVVERSFQQMNPQAASKIKGTKAGLAYKYYEGEWDFLPDFNKLSILKEGTVSTVNESLIEHRDNTFGIVMEGYVDLPATDTYTFFTRSDDGSKLYINGHLVVDNDGHHGAFWEYGTTILEKGKHHIRIEYFEAYGSEMLRAGLLDPDMGKVPFHPGQLSH
ncbi:MAG: metallophosphoesterase [Chitinophagales bacterium]|nr:metallophosphoesterase [Chitinophagales bacterium]